MQANLSWLCFFSSALPRGVQPNSKPDQPKQPAWTQTDNRPNWPLRRSVTGFCFQDLTPAGRVAGFLLRNPSHPTRSTLYKSDNIRGDPSEIWWDPARFEEIQADFGDFWCRSTGFLQIPENFLKISATIWCIFAQISWVLQKSGDDLMYFCLDLVIFAQILRRSGEKYRSPSKWNLRQHHRRLQPIRPLIKQLQSDLTRWCLRSAAGFLAGNPMSSGRFRVGHKPDPDRPVDTPSSPLAEWP